MRWSVVALALAVGAVAAGAGAAKGLRECGTVVAHAYGDGSYRYSVRVEQGSVACSAARAAAKAFIERSTQPKGWVCFRGHSGQPWAIACSPATGKFRSSVVKAYLLGKA